MLVINKHFACMQKDLLSLCTHIACMCFVSNQQHMFAVVMRSYCMYAFCKQSTAHVCCCYAFILYACVLQAINSTCLLLLCIHIVCMHLQTINSTFLLLFCTHIVCMYFANNQQHMFAVVMHSYCMHAFCKQLIAHFCCCYALTLYVCILQAITSTVDF